MGAQQFVREMCIANIVTNLTRTRTMRDQTSKGVRAFANLHMMHWHEERCSRTTDGQIYSSLMQWVCRTPCHNTPSIEELFFSSPYCESSPLCSSGLYTASLQIRTTFLKNLLHSTGSPLALTKLISSR